MNQSPTAFDVRSFNNTEQFSAKLYQHVTSF